MASKKDALGLYIRDTATKLQNTGENLRLFLLAAGAFQILIILTILSQSGYVGVLGILIHMVMIGGILAGAWLAANYIRFMSDLMAMMSLKMVENEVTEKDVENFPMIPSLEDGPETAAQDTDPGRTD